MGTFAINMLIVLREKGLSRLTSAGHLPLWIPLAVFEIYELTIGRASLRTQDGALYAYFWLHTVVNSISLAFDVLETARWVRGQREFMYSVGGGEESNENAV